MPRARLASPVLAAIFACGPELPATSTDAASTSTGATASTTADATTAAPTTSSSSTATSTTTPGTTEALTTAPATDGSTVGPDTTTSSSTTDPGTTDASSSTTDPGGSTGAPDPAQYAAQYFAGGLDRIFVRKADPDADLCTEVVFVWPGNPSPGLTLPAMWGLQWSIVTSGVAGCLDFQKPLQNGVMAASVAGTAAWDAMFCPKTLDVDVLATFPQGQPWVPAQVALQAAALPLQGC